jgi:branched-chain amino acid transport system substrate-binding protein
MTMFGRTRTRGAIATAVFLALVLGVAACGGGGGGGNGPGSKSLDLVIGNALPLGGEGAGGASAKSGTTTSEGTTTTEETTTDGVTTSTSTDTTTTASGGAGETDSALGESGQKASDLAIEQIQSAIEQAGVDHSVRAVNEDQGPDEDSAQAAADTLVHSDGANCLTGPWSAANFEKAAKTVAVPSKTLEISPTPTSEDTSDLSDHDLINSTALPVALEGDAIAKAISDDLGGTEGNTVNVAASNDSYGDSLSQGFIESWQGEDGTVGGQVVIAPPPLSSSTSGSYSTGGYSTSGSSGYSSVYSSQVAQLTSGSPDGVLLLVDPETLANLGGSLGSTYTWNPDIAWGGDELVTPSLPDTVGADVVDGMRALAPGIPRGEEAGTAFVDAFKSAPPHRTKIAPYAAQEFDATILCYLAAVAAGSTEGQAMADHLVDITAPGGEEFSWQQLPGAIEALEDGKDIDYSGATGPIDLDIRGEPTRGVYDVYQFTSSGLEIVGEVSVSKPNPATP